ncbi:MAG: ATP-binding cassette domain-containing protein [Jatrophihabitans sp.]|uniref:ATP-binding cassette domain-containing protein n=1 Tax=Jatrophihabitans sp. TaxID=1932789 RepID=UPI003F7CF35D
MTGVKLAVEDLSFRYGATQVLDDVSFTAADGVIGLVGANGAGKTTLLRLLAGVLRPDQGRVTTGGGDGGAASIGYLPQSPSATPLLRADAYVQYLAALAGVPRRRVPVAADAALARVGMTKHARTRTSKLSGGMFRRVALAGALAAEPDVLLLDEPTAGLDPVQRVRFRDLIRELGQDRLVIVASHLLEDVGPIAQQIIVLNGTHKVFDGTVDELTDRGGSLLATGVRPSVEAALIAMMGPDES